VFDNSEFRFSELDAFETISFSPEKNEIFFGGENSFTIWDSRSHQTHSNTETNGAILGFGFSPDNQTIAFTKMLNEKFTIELWDRESHSKTLDFDCDEIPYDSIHLDKNSLVANSSFWGGCMVAELNPQRILKKNDTYAITTPHFHPWHATTKMDGMFDIKNTSEYSIQIRDMNFESSKTIHSTKESIHFLSNTPDGRELAFWSDNKATFVDVVTGDISQEFTSDSAFGISNSGNVIATSVDGKDIVLQNRTTPSQRIGKIYGAGSVDRIQFSADDTQLLTIGNDAKLWSLTQTGIASLFASPTSTESRRLGRAKAIAVSQAGFVAGLYTKIAEIKNLANRETVSTLRAVEQEFFYALRFDNSGRKLAILSNKQVKFLRFKEDTGWKPFGSLPLKLNSLSFSNDGEFAIGNSDEHSFRIGMTNSTPVVISKTDSAEISFKNSKISPNGKWLATLHDDRVKVDIRKTRPSESASATISLRNKSNHQVDEESIFDEFEQPDHDNTIEAISNSLVALRNDYAIEFYSFAGQKKQVIEMVSSEPALFRFSSDGKRFAAARNGKLTLWEVESGIELISFDLKEKLVDFTFSENDDAMFFLYRNRRIEFWQNQDQPIVADLDKTDADSTFNWHLSKAGIAKGQNNQYANIFHLAWAVRECDSKNKTRYTSLFRDACKRFMAEKQEDIENSDLFSKDPLHRLPSVAIRLLDELK